MRRKLAILALGIAAMLLGLSPSAKADTFQYDYTAVVISDSFGVHGSINIVFTLTAATLPTSGDVTSFTSVIDPFGTVTEFAWNSAGFPFSFCIFPGPFAQGACTVLINEPPPSTPPGTFILVETGDIWVPGSFLSPGTYTGEFHDTMVITDLGPVGAPEPSSLILLGWGFGLMAMASFSLRIRRFASVTQRNLFVKAQFFISDLLVEFGRGC
jgi:hypothetical protein